MNYEFGFMKRENLSYTVLLFCSMLTPIAWMNKSTGGSSLLAPVGLLKKVMNRNKSASK